ncbi:Cytochrome P450 2C50, partial [Varanus komodoensis]
MPPEKGKPNDQATSEKLGESGSMMQTSESLTSIFSNLIPRSLKRLLSLRRLPPGPLRLPLVGGMWRFGVKLSHDTFLKLAKQYGNLYTIWIGYKPAIILSGFRAVKECLSGYAEEFVDRPVTPFLEMTGKNRGIVISNGHTWKQQRRFAVGTMRKLGLGKKGTENEIAEEARELVEIFTHAK